jgi:predicted nucleic-acid-binding Zn-ribbon protein
MDRLVPCPGCGGNTLYERKDVGAGGSHGPDLLPSLGRFISSAKFAVVVCRDCGLTRFYAQPEARAKLKDSRKWKLV